MNPAAQYECPVCFRVAPWTDGTMAAYNYDSEDEDTFWCQTCGAETPLRLVRPVGVHLVRTAWRSRPARPRTAYGKRGF